MVDYDLDAGGAASSESQESQRQSALWKVDPVNVMSISATVKQCVQVAEASGGAATAAFAGLQPPTLAALRELAA